MDKVKNPDAAAYRLRDCNAICGLLFNGGENSSGASDITPLAAQHWAKEVAKDKVLRRRLVSIFLDALCTYNISSPQHKLLQGCFEITLQPFAENQVNKYFSANFPDRVASEEAFDAAKDGVREAIIHFPHKGEFMAFCTTIIERRLVDLTRRNLGRSGSKTCFSRQRNLPPELKYTESFLKEFFDTPASSLSPVSPKIHPADRSEIIDDLCRVLPLRQAEVMGAIVEHYQPGITNYSYLAASLNMSEPTFNVSLSQARDNIAVRAPTLGQKMKDFLGVDLTQPGKNGRLRISDANNFNARG